MVEQPWGVLMAQDKSASIHPRVKSGHRKINTCGNSSLIRRLTRQLAGIEAHLKHNPRDGLSSARVATIKALLRG
jgi:hypothetical protein